MSYGFVYMLHNPLVRGVKIGSTEGSPHARAAQLSAASGVPAPFQVICYLELKGYVKFERQLHEMCADYRLNTRREFFNESAVTYAACVMYWHPRKASFCAVDLDYLEGGLFRPLSEFPNPWLGCIKEDLARFQRGLDEIDAAVDRLRAAELAGRANQVDL